jgi:CubicO group peptidase (beta-lactamase class C family)
MRTAATCIGFVLLAATANAQTRDRARIGAVADSIVGEALKGGRAAGMSVAVVLGRDTVVMKGYGLADLEFNVPTPPRAIYEIGSITKQFTAAAVLQLQEQGKLSLDDDVTKFLPDYPAKGRRITLRRLLDHTSGIKGYTELPEFGTLMMRKLPRDSLVALFSSKPFDFEPGEAAIYNNSAFFLLGLVIEKASGQTYEEYVKKNLFERAGMSDSRYCSERAVVKNRAHGYDAGPGGQLLRAAYLDHSWPYAAGSLCSTVEDLMAWNHALHGGRVLSAASYRELITPGSIKDGTRLRYAKGIAVDSLLGHRVIQHGGGINGFVSDLKYFPDDSLHIAVLINTAGAVAPGTISRAIAQTVLGAWSLKSADFRGKVQDYEGEYRGVGRGTQTIVNVVAAADGRGLARRMPNGSTVPLLYLGGEAFDANGPRFTFVREGGRVTKLRFDAGSTYAILTRR